MIIISERKFTQEEIVKYMEKDIRLAYGYDVPTIRRGESVGFILETMYKSTIEKIEYLLATKHKVTLNYEGKSYVLYTLDEWKRSYREGFKNITIKHPLLEIYEIKREEYFERIQRQKDKEKAEALQDLIIPVDLDPCLRIFTKLYELEYPEDTLDAKLSVYHQIQTYLDLGMPYQQDGVANSIEAQALMYQGCIDADDTPYFRTEMFYTLPITPELEVVSFGDSNYFEDTVHQYGIIH